MADTIYLTQEGFDAKKKELNELYERRPQAIEAVKIAREFGDLSENAEYDAAKDEQGRIEDRIHELEELINHARILEDVTSDVIMVGSKVLLLDEEMEEEMEVSIVNTVEADYSSGKISTQSLLGQSLVGKKAGDEIEIKAPAGIAKFRILRVGF
jgi:transcription elongation factor GreA